jgi:DNA polymerase III subunit beta
MHIQVLKENWQRAASLASRFAATKAQLPILAQACLTADKGGIHLMASDLTSGIRLRVGGKVLGKGATAVPAKLLVELANSLPLGTVELQSEEGEGLLVRAGNTKATVNSMSTEEFPEIVRSDKGVELGEYKVSEMKYWLERVGFVVSADESRPVLTGVMWEVSRNRIVATDGYRLSMVRGKMKSKAKVSKLLVGGAFWREAVKVFDELGEESVRVWYDEEQRQLAVEGGDALVVGRVMEGEYPDYEAILPKEHRFELVLEREALLQAVRAAAIFARDSANIVRLSVGKGMLVVSANAPQVGGNVVEVEAEGASDEVADIAFNSKYLIEFLMHAETERVVFKMLESLKPGTWEEAGNDSFVHVIMPVRVKGGEE